MERHHCFRWYNDNVTITHFGLYVDAWICFLIECWFLLFSCSRWIEWMDWIWIQNLEFYIIHRKRQKRERIANGEHNLTKTLWQEFIETFSTYQIENVCKAVAAVWWKASEQILASGSAVHQCTKELRPELLSYNCLMCFSTPGKVFAGTANTPMKQIQEVVVACQREFTSNDSFTWTPGGVLATDFLHQPSQGRRSCSKWE